MVADALNIAEHEGFGDEDERVTATYPAEEMAWVR
jgi:hypothetical protein